MSRYAISAIALERGEISQCRIHPITGGNAQAPTFKEPGEVVDADEVIDMIKPDGDEFFALRKTQGRMLPPERVKVFTKPNGDEYLASHVDGVRTESLHSLPRI